MKKVYVAKYKGIYKIGVSGNVERRLKQLQCGCPGIVPVYESTFLDNAFQVEHELHNEFKSYCIGGEWFSDVDFFVVENIIRAKGKKAKTIKYNRNADKFDIETFAGGVFSINALMREAEREKSKNEQLESFLLAVKGVDISNIYSDLIYEVLFNKDAKQLIKEYNPNKYESFRNYLSDEQNSKIEALTKVVVGLIGLDWNFDTIKDFILDMYA